MSTTFSQVVALFGAGVASFLAPCIVPLVPAYLGIIVGEMGDARDPARAVPATLLFIAGFTTVFAGLGAAAGLLGSSLIDVPEHGARRRRHRDHRDGLALLGVVRGPLARERRLIPTLPEGHRRRAAVRRRHRVRRGLEPVRRTAARRRARRSRRARARSCTARCCSSPTRRASACRSCSPRSASRRRPALAERLRRVGPTLERVSGVLLVVLGLLLVTNTYQHLTSYLARFVPTVHGL